MVDGTTVLDIKPYIPYDIIPSDIPLPMILNEHGDTLLETKLTVPTWIYEADIMMKRVTFNEVALSALQEIYDSSGFRLCYTIDEAKELIIQVLRQDIRGVHQGRGIDGNSSNDNNTTTNTSGSSYMCRLDTFEIEFINSHNSIDVIMIKRCKD
jgi:hypothetical protein